MLMYALQNKNVREEIDMNQACDECNVSFDGVENNLGMSCPRCEIGTIIGDS